MGVVERSLLDDDRLKVVSQFLVEVLSQPSKAEYLIEELIGELVHALIFLI